MEFQKLTQVRFKSKSAIIAEQILQMMKNGGYKIGDKLPPERVIAEQMGEKLRFLTLCVHKCANRIYGY